MSIVLQIGSSMLLEYDGIQANPWLIFQSSVRDRINCSIFWDLGLNEHLNGRGVLEEIRIIATYEQQTYQMNKEEYSYEGSMTSPFSSTAFVILKAAIREATAIQTAENAM
jgi:hypothetical protein